MGNRDRVPRHRGRPVAPRGRVRGAGRTARQGPPAAAGRAVPPRCAPPPAVPRRRPCPAVPPPPRRAGCRVDQPHSVVGAVRLGEDAVGDRAVGRRAAARVGVAVHAVAVRQQAEPAGHRPQFGAEGAGGSSLEPADRARAHPGRRPPGAPGAGASPRPGRAPATRRADRPNRAAPHPHRVVVEHRALDAVDVGHGEQRRRSQAEARHPGRLGDARRDAFGVPTAVPT